MSGEYRTSAKLAARDPFGGDIIPIPQDQDIGEAVKVINQTEDGGEHQMRRDALSDFGNLGGMNGSLSTLALLASPRFSGIAGEQTTGNHSETLW